jgi:hypothetical protein
MSRITKPEKWKDTFFHNLKPIEKLIFIYLYENCDDAGFFEINFEKMAYDIGLKTNEIASSFNKLEKSFLVSKNADKIWIKKFLLHQNKLPLDLKTTDGNFIKFTIESNLDNFNNSSDFHIVLRNIKKKSPLKKNEFNKPSLDEVINNFKSGEWSFISEDEINQIYDYYESVGWKVGSKKMADWNKAFIGCFRRNFNRNKRPNTFNNQQAPKTKLDNIMEQNEKIKGFDFNSLR